MGIEKQSLFLLYATTFCIFYNYNSAQTIMPIYILHAGGTEFFSGLQNTLFFITAVALRFFFGPLADRKGNKLALYIGTLAFTAAPLLFLFSQQVWYIILVRIFQAVGLAAYFSSASSLVSALAPKEKLGTYIGTYRLVTVSTYMISPVLSFNIIDSYGYQIYHVGGILIGMIALGMLFTVREPRQREQLSTTEERIPRFNMLELLKDKQLSSIYLSIFSVAFASGILITFAAIYIKQYLPGINPGIYFTIFGLGSLLSNLISGSLSDRWGRNAVAFPCMLIMSLGTACFFFLPGHTIILFIASFMAGFGQAGSITVFISWIVDVVNPAKRTTALALQDSSIDIGIASGSFIYGSLIIFTGMSWAFFVSGSLLFIFALWKSIEVYRQRIPEQI